MPAGVNSLGAYVEEAATPTSDRVCTALTVCNVSSEHVVSSFQPTSLDDMSLYPTGLDDMLLQPTSLDDMLLHPTGLDGMLLHPTGLDGMLYAKWAARLAYPCCPSAWPRAT